MNRLREEALRKRARLYRRLRQVAAAGQVCPSNAELAFDIGYKNVSNVRDQINNLIDEGLIECESRGGKRIVTICETGQRTANPFTESGPVIVRPKRPVRDIAEAILEKTGASQRDVLGRSRYREHVRVRQMICALSAREGWPINHIGRVLKIDHSTVCHSRDVLPVWMKAEPETARIVAEIAAMLPPLPERVLS